MTQDERNMLADLANKFAQTPTPPRDPEAEDYIRKSIGLRPDALYLMTQTVLIQNMALQQAQHQIQDMQQRLSQPVPTSQGSGGSFLGQSAPPQPQYQYAPAPPSQTQYAPAPSATSSFLRNAAQTAAGVAAGTLAVQGIESLFSGHSGFGGGGYGGGMFGGGGVGGYGGGETVIENNYYGDSDRDQNDRFADAGSNDISNNDQDQLQDTSFDDTNSGLSDDTNFDDSGTDDNFNFS
jgi:hypothetical protein